MKILILGKKKESLEKSYKSTEMLFLGLCDGFKKINIEVETLDYRQLIDKPEIEIPSNISNVDFIIAIVYVEKNNRFNEIKEKVKAKKIITVREVPFHTADFSFIFNPEFQGKEKVEYVGIPCLKHVLVGYAEKEHNSILLDHDWPGCHDFTAEISNWLEEKDEYKVYRLYFDKRVPLKEREQAINKNSYMKYLQTTSHIENFVVTHVEGFPYSVIDMAVRGTRIFAPFGFIPQILVETFNINVFSSKEEFLEKLSKPIDINEQKKNIDKCITYDDLAKIVFEKMKSWM